MLIPCMIHEGMFPNEYGVIIVDVEGKKHSTFVDAGLVKIQVEVLVIDEFGDKILIRMPGECFGSPLVWVKK